jgi:hypothetical protein
VVGCIVWSTTASSSSESVARSISSPQPGAECLDRLRGVVAAAVEAPVHRLLDAPPGWLHQRRYGQRGPGHGQVVAVAAGQLPEHQHSTGVGETEERGQESIDQGPVDDDPDVVQVMAQDRDGGRGGNQVSSNRIGPLPVIQRWLLRTANSTTAHTSRVSYSRSTPRARRNRTTSSATLAASTPTSSSVASAHNGLAAWKAVGRINGGTGRSVTAMAAGSSRVWASKASPLMTVSPISSAISG